MNIETLQRAADEISGELAHIEAVAPLLRRLADGLEALIRMERGPLLAPAPENPPKEHAEQKTVLFVRDEAAETNKPEETYADAILAVLVGDKVSMSGGQIDQLVEQRLGRKASNIWSALSDLVRQGRLMKTGMFYALPGNQPTITTIEYRLPEKWIAHQYRQWKINRAKWSELEFGTWARNKAAELGRAPVESEFDNDRRTRAA